MKKVLLCFLLLFCLVGCTKDNPTNYEQILNEFVNSLSIPEELDHNLDLKSSYEYQGYNIEAIWTSSDSDFLTNSGVINQDDEDNFVSLSLELKLNDISIYHTYDITILAIDNSVIANEILDLINIPNEITNNISLVDVVNYKDKNYHVSWGSSNEDIISSDGKIKYFDSDQNVILTARISYNKIKYTREFKVVLKAFDTTDMKQYLNSLNIPKELNENISLDTKYINNNITYSVTWESSSKDILSNEGIMGKVYVDTDITLVCTISIDNIKIQRTFNVTVLKQSFEQLINSIIEETKIQAIITNNIFLPLTINDIVNCEWKSSNQEVITNEGIINTNISSPTAVTLSAVFSIGENIMTKEYNTIVSPIKHLYKTNKFEGTLNNIKVNDLGKLVLEDNATEGTFISEEYEHSGFYEAVATWNAITSQNATCELEVSIKVGDKFSDYVSYGIWGLGLKNKCVDQSNSLIKLNDDEIKVLNNKTATGFRYKITLRRNNIATASPIVSLVSVAFNIKDYNYDVDNALIGSGVQYDVPKLYQHDVPTIGNSICSITSSTMLLKYKGHDFSNINKLEHEYIAGLFKDYGNDIFGNWVYNCVGMGSYGEISYVKRFFSTNEFLYSLQEVGPMAASIAGSVNYTKIANNEKGSYKTNGHLIVVTGFEIIDGNTNIYINDPNVNGVAVKMTLSDFLNVWRNVSYIVE